MLVEFYNIIEPDYDMRMGGCHRTRPLGIMGVSGTDVLPYRFLRRSYYDILFCQLASFKTEMLLIRLTSLNVIKDQHKLIIITNKYDEIVDYNILCLLHIDCFSILVKC